MPDTFSIRSVPFADDLLLCLADDLLALDHPERALVLLPSSRACRTLGHTLLESSGQKALLLPRILTPAQFEEELAMALGLDGGNVPGDRVRHLLLAHRLKDEPWLADRPESAPGLAREFVELFDEVRRHGLQERLLEGDGLPELVAIVGSKAADQQEAELERLHRVWDLYRAAVPRDGVDLTAELAAQAGRPENRDTLAAVSHAEPLLVAGFANLDPLRAAVLRAAGDVVDDSRLYLPAATGRLDSFFTSTWSRAGSGELDPLAPARRVQDLLAPTEAPAPEEPDEPGPSLRERVAALGDRQAFWAPDGPLELLACGTAEDESLVVADRVVRLLAADGGAARRTAIVTNDPTLAARVVAQLRDAGVDTDQTLGAPLSTLPAGLLLRFILRTAVTDFRPDSLLEVLTHPFVRIGQAGGKDETWVLRLERTLRRHQGAQPGAEGLSRLAADRDAAARQLRSGDGDEAPKPGLEDYVAAVLAAFHPLTDLNGRMFITWQEGLEAIRAVWNALCPEQPLFENKERSDLTALARLLDDLERDAGRLPETRVKDMAADLGRLLGMESVAPHRGQAKPVLVTGTVEARLERFDQLILCGMADGSFPARGSRPLFLNGALRGHLGLPDWRGANARDAELFLRLLYNAPHVLVTWPTEGGGRAILPSPFVERLALALPEGREPERAVTPRPWRRQQDFDPIPAQFAFAAEPSPPKSHVELRPLNRLSWSALHRWRDCHYRHLLERGLMLRKEEEVREEFGRKDHGSLVHRCLEQFLDPDGAGYAALLAGHTHDAEAYLDSVARALFLPPGEDTALRRLWLENFLRCVPAIVQVERERFRHWRPVHREQVFELPLSLLRERLEKMASAEFPDRTVPAAEKGDAEIILRGTIDRVDRYVDSLGQSEARVAVIDYKTGKMPKAKDLENLEDLQIVLYALVLEALHPDTHVAEGSYYAVSEVDAGPPKNMPLTADGRHLLVQGGAELIRMARAAADEKAPFDLVPRQVAGEGPPKLPCTWCDFRGVCRLEEKAGLPEAVASRLDDLVNRKEGQF